MKTWKTKSGYRVVRVLSGRSNVFLVTDGAGNILIDTSPNYMRRLLERRLQKLNVARIDYLVLTHTHSDHAGNSFRIKEKYSARVLVHRSEAPYLASGRNIVPEGTNAVTRAIMKALGTIFAERFRYPPCRPDIIIDDVFDLRAIGFNALILHTPGHTPGSMSVVIDDEIALVGDTMFGVFRRSVFPPYALDVPQMIWSWGRLLAEGCQVFLPSHGSAKSRSRVEKDYNRRKPQ